MTIFPNQFPKIILENAITENNFFFCHLLSYHSPPSKTKIVVNKL